nr:reverse transcriptase domain-containing protein [Tanacetum cinerariifolium]
INVLRGDFNKHEEKLRRNLNDDMRSILGSFFQNQPSTSSTLSSNTVPNPKGEIKAVNTRSGLAYEGPPIPTNSPLEKVDEQNTKEIMEKEHSNCPGRMDVCHALADLRASINRMPLLIWKKLSLPELTLTRMTLELADRSITRPKRVDEGVFVKVGKLYFPTDFVVVDFEADPRVSLILGRSFLRTDHALINVYGEEITLRVNDESITFNLNQTMRYSLTYDDNFVNRVDFIDIACEEFVQDVLDFQYNPKSSSPTLVSDSSNPESDFIKEPIVKSSSPTLTPFRESDFFLEEVKDFLNDDSIPMGIENSVYVKGVRGFLGHAGFYHHFIQDFSKIARPMTHLLKKETPFVFSKECIDAFNTLKKKLTEAPILVVPSWNLPFELMCDASDFAISAVLGQRKMKHFQPIHYASKTMTEAQIHYTTTKKEIKGYVITQSHKRGEWRN